MKTALIASLTLVLAVSAKAGDWGKAPVDKTPIEECLDLGGVLGVGYHSHYLYKGYLLGQDTVSGELFYTFDSLFSRSRSGHPTPTW